MDQSTETAKTTQHTHKTQTKDNAVKIKSIFRRKKAFGLFWQLLGVIGGVCQVKLMREIVKDPKIYISAY